MYFNAEEFGKRMQKVRCENHLTQEQLQIYLISAEFMLRELNVGHERVLLIYWSKSQMRCMFQPIFC